MCLGDSPEGTENGTEARGVVGLRNPGSGKALDEEPGSVGCLGILKPGSETGTCSGRPGESVTWNCRATMELGQTILLCK